MKRATTLAIFFVFLFVSSNLFWIYETQKDKETMDFMSNTMSDLSQKLYALDLLDKARMHELNLNGFSLPVNLNIQNIHGDDISIEKISTTYKLVLRYTELNCHTCIEEQIKNLNAYIDSIGVENILAITSASNPMYLYSFKKTNNIKFPLYKTSFQDSIMEDIGIPYFFILTPERKMINVFIPYKEMPQYTSMYLHNIYKTYFKKEQ